MISPKRFLKTGSTLAISRADVLEQFRGQSNAVRRLAAVIAAHAPSLGGMIVEQFETARGARRQIGEGSENLEQLERGCEIEMKRVLRRRTVDELAQQINDPDLGATPVANVLDKLEEPQSGRQMRERIAHRIQRGSDVDLFEKKKSAAFLMIVNRLDQIADLERASKRAAVVEGSLTDQIDFSALSAEDGSEQTGLTAPGALQYNTNVLAYHCLSGQEVTMET
jgi:hypothetical protein